MYYLNIVIYSRLMIVRIFYINYSIFNCMNSSLATPWLMGGTDPPCFSVCPDCSLAESVLPQLYEDFALF